MTRWNIINYFIKKYNYKSYLEIGTFRDECLSEIKCEHKTGVDPAPAIRIEGSCNLFYELTSDDFFSLNRRGYDIILIDGLHHSKQVIKDGDNALLVLNEGGTIVVHDCKPQHKNTQVVPIPQVIGGWNGDVWRAWMYFRKYENLRMFVINQDEGCGIIRRGKQINPIELKHQEVTYEEFAENRELWLNLINFNNVEEWLK